MFFLKYPLQNFSVLTLENKFQSIATGPVAALESIKHLGTNGGGWFFWC